MISASTETSTGTSRAACKRGGRLRQDLLAAAGLDTWEAGYIEAVFRIGNKARAGRDRSAPRAERGKLVARQLPWLSTGLERRLNHEIRVAESHYDASRGASDSAREKNCRELR